MRLRPSAAVGNGQPLEGFDGVAGYAIAQDVHPGDIELRGGAATAGMPIPAFERHAVDPLAMELHAEQEQVGLSCACAV